MWRRLTCVLLLSLICHVLVAAERPNIVVILCDDLGYGDLECYGHPQIKTPNLNKLAQSGIRFTDCYSAAPVCSPSRVGLLTGRSPNRAGVYDWIPAAGPNPRPDAREQVHMRRDELTIPQLLNDAGYVTCMSGKWHCNSRFNNAAQPQPGDFGFDHWFGTQNNAAPNHENPKNFVRNGEAVGPLEGYSCQLVVDEAVSWLDKRMDEEKERPFFAYLAFHEPHEPVASPKELVATYKGVAKNENEAHYFANVHNVDIAVGRVVKALQDREILENTLIVFTSDNGPETLNRYGGAKRSYGTPGQLKGMKLHTHDAGFRVAGIMSWPAKIKAGQTVDTPVSSLDLLPTFCELAQAEIPDDRKLDGLSLIPLLEEMPLQRKVPLHWLYFNALNDARMSMRDGDWKVLARLNGGDFPRLENVTTDRVEAIKNARLTNFEIYNIREDMQESKNLVNSDRPEIEDLQRKLIRYFRELTDDSHVWAKASPPATAE